MRIIDGVTKCQLAPAQMIALAGQFVAINGEIETLSTDDDEANENGNEKLHSRVLNKFAMISAYLVCVMWPNYSGSNDVRADLKLRKRKEN